MYLVVGTTSKHTKELRDTLRTHDHPTTPEGGHSHEALYSAKNRKTCCAKFEQDCRNHTARSLVNPARRSLMRVPAFRRGGVVILTLCLVVHTTSKHTKDGWMRFGEAAGVDSWTPLSSDQVSDICVLTVLMPSRWMYHNSWCQSTERALLGIADTFSGWLCLES